MKTPHIINVLTSGITHTDPRYGSVVETAMEGAAPLHKLDVAFAIVRPGAASPPHYHELTEEVYFIISGRGVMTIDGVSTPVEPGDVIRIPVYTIHSIVAGDEELKFAVATTPPYTVDDDIETDAVTVDTPSMMTNVMTEELTVAILTGTHRRGSVSAMIARQISDMYRALGVSVDLIDLAELPCEIFLPGSFDHRYEADSPIAQRFIKADGLHVVVPEYNGSYPGVLKHVLDVQPYQRCFRGKPTCFTGVAAGEWGALRAVEQLQQVFGYRNAFIFPQRVLIREVEEVKFDDAQRIVDAELVGRMERQAAEFIEFVRCLKPLRKAV